MSLKPDRVGTKRKKGKASKIPGLNSDGGWTLNCEKVPVPTWLDPSRSGDFWHRDAETTLRRFHAEAKLGEYAKARAAATREDAIEWGEIRMRHLPELLRKVPDAALWSVTVQDLIASAWDEARDVFVIRGRVGGKDVLEVQAPDKRQVPATLRGIAAEDFGGEALAALRAFAAVLANPPSKADVWDELDAIKVTRADLARGLNAESEAVKKAKQRAKNPETAREASKRAGQKRRAKRRS